ncbi:expressed unknown protein [Seminavis robusta]|uniref:Uncharacterized protein n=1 Tax=Seminavis robusta TaxID=568900 RepID=A0A9N8DWY0_9STRA|nr:expressed unknown protein [Seminavis robusta]|eukprot:Sro438_g143030.1 n/a (363) ;mRNA; r:31576-32664
MKVILSAHHLLVVSVVTFLGAPTAVCAWNPHKVSKTQPVRKTVRRALGYRSSATTNIQERSNRATISLDRYKPPTKSKVRSTKAIAPRATRSVQRKFDATDISPEITDAVVTGATSFFQALSVILKGSVSAVKDIEPSTTQEERAKISRSGKGLFKLGKDLVGSSASFVKNGLWKRNDPKLTYSATRPATRAIRPARATRPADESFLGTRPVGSLGTHPVVGGDRPTISLSAVEASQYYGLSPYDSRIYPNGVDYMMVHWQTLQETAGMWLEGARCYTSSATAEMVQGFNIAYEDALDKVVQFQSHAMMSFEPPKHHIPAPQDFFFATTRTFPIVNDNVRKVAFVCPTPVIDPNALYFVTML